MEEKTLYVVGIGPGDREDMTIRADRIPPIPIRESPIPPFRRVIRAEAARKAAVRLRAGARSQSSPARRQPSASGGKNPHRGENKEFL